MPRPENTKSKFWPKGAIFLRFDDILGALIIYRNKTQVLLHFRADTGCQPYHSTIVQDRIKVSKKEGSNFVCEQSDRSPMYLPHLKLKWVIGTRSFYSSLIF